MTLVAPPGDPWSSEHAAYASAHPRYVLIVRRADASLMAYPMRGHWIDGRLCSSTYRASAKVGHLLANADVCCVVRADDLSSRRHGLAIWGRVAFDEIPIDAWIEHLTTTRDDDDIAITPALAEKVADRLRSGARTLLSITPTTAQFLEALDG